MYSHRALYTAIVSLMLACAPKPEALKDGSVAADTAIGVVPPSREDPIAPAASPPAVPPDTSPPTGRILVAVTVDRTGSVTFDPVYYLPPDGLPSGYPPGLDTGVVSFQARYTNPSRPYVVLDGGDSVGTLYPTEAYQSSCTGTGYTGKGYMTPVISGTWAGLAITGPAPSVAWRRLELTTPERLSLGLLARPLLLALEDTPAGADSALLDRGFAYQSLTDSTRLLAAALHHDALRPGPNYERLSVFIIARRDSTGLVPVYSWSHGGIEEGRQERGFLDAADLDGDGTLEFVTSVSYYESTTYQVIQANGGEWSPGAGAGC